MEGADGKDGSHLVVIPYRGDHMDSRMEGVGDDQGKTLTKVGGRLLGRYWYNAEYGGAPNRI